jgi:hypothetical protein
MKGGSGGRGGGGRGGCGGKTLILRLALTPPRELLLSMQGDIVASAGVLGRVNGAEVVVGVVKEREGTIGGLDKFC